MDRREVIGTRWLYRRGAWCGLGWVLRCERAQHFAQRVFGLRHALAGGRQGSGATCMHRVAGRVGGADDRRGLLGGRGERT
ncbi:hypothetical protein ACDH70_19265 [Xanthomonas axonopodis pv. poinsettiicola]|uniref:hypothetical protein n=1 Tax=Xanthomonas axonopodis TaxID=53413 RepID=UPI00269335FA